MQVFNIHSVTLPSHHSYQVSPKSDITRQRRNTDFGQLYGQLTKTI